MGGINPAHKKSPLLTINEKKAIFITTFEHLACLLEFMEVLTKM